jgi:hypothetical protein
VAAAPRVLPREPRARHRARVLKGGRVARQRPEGEPDGGLLQRQQRRRLQVGEGLGDRRGAAAEGVLHALSREFVDDAPDPAACANNEPGVTPGVSSDQSGICVATGKRGGAGGGSLEKGGGARGAQVWKAFRAGPLASPREPVPAITLSR